jgi:hypothetical protein
VHNRRAGYGGLATRTAPTEQKAASRDTTSGTFVAAADDPLPAELTTRCGGGSWYQGRCGIDRGGHHLRPPLISGRRAAT